jgi:ribonuclease HII
MLLAVERAILKLRLRGLTEIPLLLIDGNQKLDTKLPQRTIIKGDATELSIGAASILAKVSRDRMMGVLDAKYPGYGLAGHKGYGTKMHLDQLRELGPTPIHRRSFAGVCTNPTQSKTALESSLGIEENRLLPSF